MQTLKKVSRQRGRKPSHGKASSLVVAPPALRTDLTDPEPQEWKQEEESSENDLASKMARDKGFIQGTELGLKELEQGRYSSIEDVKRKLGDL